MMKVLLIAPPWLDIYGDFKAAAKLGCASPPLGLMYLAASIRGGGGDCRIIDMEAQQVGPDRLIELIGEYRPDLVGITATTPVFKNACSLAGLIKRHYPEVILGVGGVHSTIVGQEVLQECSDFDFQVCGEGERTIVDIVAAMKAGRSLDGVAGVICRNGERIIENPRRPLTEDLDSIAVPARCLVPSSLYKHSVPGKGFVQYSTVFTSRGCPFQCVFCSQHTMYGRTMRWHSLERVLEELRHITRDLDIHHVIIMDETMTLDKKRILAFCEAVCNEGLDFTWEGWTHASTIDEEIMVAMKSAGLVRLSFGIESGDPEILKVIKKNVTLDQIRHAYRIAEKVGIETRGSAMLGHPFETKASAWRTIKFIRSIRELKQVFLNIACPYPGTELYDYAVNGRGGMRLLTKDYSQYKRYGAPVIEVGDMKAKDLKRIQTLGLLFFYLTPGRIWYNVFKRAGIRAGLKNVTAFSLGILKSAIGGGLCSQDKWKDESARI